MVTVLCVHWRAKKKQPSSACPVQTRSKAQPSEDHPTDNDYHPGDRNDKSSPELFETINQDNYLIEIMAPKRKGSLLEEPLSRKEKEQVTGDPNPKRNDMIQSKATNIKG